MKHVNEDGNRSNFQNVVFSSFWNSGQRSMSRTPAILSDVSKPASDVISLLYLILFRVRCGCGGRSVGIVRSRNKGHGACLLQADVSGICICNRTG
jgi:hypothetical protein